MDGARIHCDANIIYYLRSIGIVPLFLPAYCPFFNPIEVLFGMVKQRFKRRYIENNKRELILVVAEVLKEFESYDLTAVFRKCGYLATGFNPGDGLKQKMSDLGYGDSDEEE